MSRYSKKGVTLIMMNGKNFYVIDMDGKFGLPCNAFLLNMLCARRLVSNRDVQYSFLNLRHISAYIHQAHLLQNYMLVHNLSIKINDVLRNMKIK